MIKSVSTVLVAAFLCLNVGVVNASVCNSHEKFTTFLAKKYSEKRKAIGLVSNTGMMEVYVSEKGTWSILMTATNGITCLIAVGDHWEDVKPKPLDPPS